MTHIDPLGSFIKKDDVSICVSIHYIEWKCDVKSNGLTLLLIHGTNQSAHTWDDFAASLSDQGFRIIAYDQRGHGDTSWAKESDEYNFDVMTSDLVCVIDELKLDISTTVICGMSLGGLISLNFLSTCKEQPFGAVIVDIAPSIEKTSIQDLRKTVMDSMVLDSFDDFVKWAQAVNPTRSVDNLRERLKWSLKEHDGKWTWKHDPRFIVATREFGSEILWEKLKSITCPVLCIHGSLSKITSLDQVKKLATRLPHGTWAQVEKAGHSVQGDNPEGMKAVFLKWLMEFRSKY
jgi:pimeloyl-ACP methyl ester carboxylesterase